ncbi:hypothetical protein ACFX11_035084 [Malus domestica]
MEANPILFQRSLRRQTHFAPELFNDKVNSAPHRCTPCLPLAVAHLAYLAAALLTRTQINAKTHGLG